MSGISNLKTYFSETLPNIVYNNDASLDLEKLTESVNGRTGKSESVLKNHWKRGNSNLFPPKQRACENIGNGDQFDHLSSLASSEDTSARLRCGWVYNNANPASGGGAYGIAQGPFKTSKQGTWMWNLNAAKEKYHTAICQGIQGCEDIDSSMYKQRCGWCTTSGKAVPIINGALAYPYSTNTSCAGNQVITQASKCPAPPPLQNPTGPRAPGEVCIPLQNGALPRDCLIAKVTAAGCSDKGALVQALRGGSDNDYTSALVKEKAFSLFQNRAAVPLNATGLKTGKMTISDALNDFKRIHDSLLLMQILDYNTLLVIYV